MLDISLTLFPAGIMFLAFAMFTLPFVVIKASNDGDRRERARLRAEGVRAEAFVKGFRRVSMTQHRVLIEARLSSGPVGRELMVSGLADDWLAHHAALGIPVIVYASPSGSTIVIDQPEQGPAPTVTKTVTHVLLVLGGVAVLSLVLGAGIAIAHEQRVRDRDESHTPHDVRRLRDAWNAAGLDVERMSPRRSKTTGVESHVSFRFESGASCTVTVFTLATGTTPSKSGRHVLENGRLTLACEESSSKDLPRIKATFQSFRP